ncbi:MAG: hypothetical protein ACI8W8_002883 [Rhodothermales bacterium]|jgi:hypothetical protein
MNDFFGPRFVARRDSKTAKLGPKIQVVDVKIDAKPGRILRLLETGILAKAGVIVSRLIDDAIDGNTTGGEPGVQYFTGTIGIRVQPDRMSLAAEFAEKSDRAKAEGLPAVGITGETRLARPWRTTDGDKGVVEIQGENHRKRACYS